MDYRIMSRLATYNILGFADDRVEFLSTASTALTLSDDQQNKILVWGGQAAASRINLPAPEQGMRYSVFFSDDAVSSATKFASSGFDIYYAHQDQVQSTAAAVAYGSTLEGGMFVEFIALNEFRWAVLRASRTTLSDGGMGTTTT